MKYSNGSQFTQAFIDGTYIDFVLQRTDILLVTFGHAAWGKMVLEDSQEPGWGGEFVLDQGYSCLFIKPTRANWYRCEALFDYFDSIKAEGFFDQFKKVVFAGGSMGGYGALAFSSLVSGSTVIALNPQVSLFQDLAPWEERFPVGRSQNWTGRYSDASKEIVQASRVLVVLDPFCKPDKLHSSLLRSPNVEFLHIPFCGHGIPVSMQKMGILKEFMKSAIEGDLTKSQFTELARKRRNIGKYYLTLYNMMLAKGKTKSASLVLSKAREAGFSIADDRKKTESKKELISKQVGQFKHKQTATETQMQQEENSSDTKQMVLKPNDIIAQLKASNSAIFAGVNEKKATRLLHLAMDEIANKLAEIEVGLVRVPGLGSFRVQQLERERDGEKTTLRRIIFNIAPPRIATANEDSSAE